MSRTRSLAAALLCCALIAGSSGCSGDEEPLTGGAQRPPGVGGSTEKPIGDPTSEAPTGDQYDKNGTYVATDADFEDVADLLDTRARAINTGNERLFRGTVDPTRPRFVEGQLAEFRRMIALGVSEVSYGVDRFGYTYDPIPGGDPGLRPGTFEHASIDDIWSHPVGNQVDFTYARRDGEWYLTAEDPPSIDDDSDWVQARPWSGDVVAKRLDGLLVVVDRDDADRLDALAARVTESVAYVRDTWHVPGGNALLVDASSTGTRTMVNEIGGKGAQAAAVTQAVFETRRADLTRTGLAGFLIKVNPDDDFDADDPRFEQLLRHELTHYVLRNVDGPLWLTEGMADYTGFRSFPLGIPSYPKTFLAQARKRMSPDELISSALFNTYPEAGYLQGFLAVRHLVLTYGVDRVLLFAGSYGVTGPDRGDAKTARLLDEAFGTTPAEVARVAFEDGLSDLDHIAY